MPQFAHNPNTGEVIIYDDQIGQWRDATRAEIDIEQSGLAGQIEAGIEGATGVQSLLGLFSPEFAARADALTGSNTAAATLGGIATLGVGSMALMGRGSATARALQRSQTRQAGGLRTGQGFIRNPEQLGPESMQGAGRIVRAGIESNPVTRMITDYLIRNPNQKNLNRLAGRAVGLTDDELARSGGRLTDDLLGLADERLGAQFDEVGARITEKIDPDEVTNLALQLNAENRISNARLAQVADNAENAGRELMGIRSELLAQSRRTSDDAVKNQIQNRIDEIDAIIEKAVSGDDVTSKLYADARARYRVSLALDKGAARSMDDNLNVPSLNNQLRKIYGAGFTKGRVPGGAPVEVQDFLKGAREARGVDVGVPSSGTAERLIAANILGIGTGISF